MYDIKQGFKLKKLYIEEYKVLKDFEIDFCDDKDIPLPLIVLAGVNGSGKTSILECIADSFSSGQIVGIINGNEQEDIITSLSSNYNSTNSILYGKVARGILGVPYDEYEIVYIPFDLNDFTFIEKTIVEYIDKLLFEEDIKASEVYKQFSDFMGHLLKEVKLNIRFLKLDRQRKVYFQKNGSEFLLDDLSSGEKSLLARVVYLYIKDIKNKVILIDEPELSLHPTWQDKILKLYENYAIQNNCQIIIATHSPLVLGSAKNSSIRILYFEANKVKVLKDVFAYGRYL